MKISIGESIAFLCGISLTATIAILMWPPREIPDAQASRRETMNRMRSLASQLDAFRQSRGEFPPRDDWARSLQDFWGGPQASPSQTRLFFDAWGNVTQLEINEMEFTLSAAGPNGILHDGDDIVMRFPRESKVSGERDKGTLYFKQ